MDYCESNKQMDRVCVSRISMKPCKFQGITAGPHGSFDKSRLCQNVEKERKKCPLKTVVLAIDEKENAIKSSRGRAQSWWRPSWAWEARVECRWHGKVVWKSNEDKTTKWRSLTNENKWRYTISQSLLEVLPSKYHRWEFLTFDYKLKKNTFQNIGIKIMWIHGVLTIKMFLLLLR